MRNVAAVSGIQEYDLQERKSYIVGQTYTDMHGDTILAAVGAG